MAAVFRDYSLQMVTDGQYKGCQEMVCSVVLCIKCLSPLLLWLWVCTRSVCVCVFSFAVIVLGVAGRGIRLGLLFAVAMLACVCLHHTARTHTDSGLIPRNVQTSLCLTGWISCTASRRTKMCSISDPAQSGQILGNQYLPITKTHYHNFNQIGATYHSWDMDGCITDTFIPTILGLWPNMQQSLIYRIISTNWL